MKKLIFIISGVVLAFGARAQFSIEAQGKGAIASTWLFNKNISDLGEEQDYAMAWGSSYGAAINFYYKNVGIGIEGLASKHVGGYSGRLGDFNYNSQVTLSGYQIPVLFKLKSDGGVYLELGVQANGISKANHTAQSDLGETSDNVSGSYAKNYMSAVFGFGANVKLSKKIPLGLLFGLRLNYGFDDSKGVDALGNDLDNKLIYNTYEKTNAASGAFMLGLTYSFELKK